MVAIVRTGPHFKDPWLMVPGSCAAGNLYLYDATPTENASSTTAFFTGVAQTGVQDTTNWSAGTYKTIYSHTGIGIVYAMIACTAGGAETTTFEITVDGVLSTITITNASGERAFLSAGGTGAGPEFTTAAAWIQPNGIGSLDSGTLSTFQTAANTHLLPLARYPNFGIPALRYDVSCLIRMKHSTNITNSTATAYSGVLVRKGISS